MVVCDTNIIIDFVRRQKGVGGILLERVAAEKDASDLAISVLTVQELYRGKSVADLEVEKKLTAVISSFKILPYTFEVAKLAGAIARDRQIAFADSAIAATAIINHSPLLTLDKKDFEGIEGLEIYKI